jgi:hypothetical protein
MKFNDYIKQPYPVLGNKWSSTFFIGLFVGAFMLVFQPFGASSIRLPYKNLILLGFGIVTMLMVGINLLLIEPLARKVFRIKNLTIGKGFIWELWIIFTIGIANYMYDMLISQSTFKWLYFSIYQFYTLTLGIIIIIIHIGFTYRHMLNKYLNEAQNLNQNISGNKQTATNQSDSLITLVPDNNKTPLEIALSGLLAVESTANYIQVYYLKDNILQKTELRSSLKKAEQTLAAYPEVVRCHRAFLVNVNNISTVNGNSQGLLLNMCNTDIKIPVSRTYTKQLKDIVQK